MQLNPNAVLEAGIISGEIRDDQIQQVGIDLTLATAVTIAPMQFANVELREKFNMQHTFGICVVRSSLSRRGLFLSSGVFDPGFQGKGGVSLYNFGTESITLDAGFRICQMIVFHANPAKLYDGHYNHNDTIESQYNGGFNGV